MKPTLALNGLLPLFLFLSISLHAQRDSTKVPPFVHPYIQDSSQMDVVYYKPDPDTTVYYALHTLFASMEPFSYFSFFGAYNKRLPHLQDFRPGETDTMKLEINFYIPLTLYRGRGMSKNGWQASRVTFDYWGQIRVGDNASSPILPPTNAFGFTWDWSPWDNFRGLFLRRYEQKDEMKEELGANFFTIRGAYDRRNFWKEHTPNDFKAVTTQVQLMHYSNGQPSGFYADGANLRHDYLAGDFSTNYLQGLVGWHLAMSRGDIFSVWGGYRHDFQLVEGLLKFAPEQEQNYGRHRLLVNLQYVTPAILFWKFKKPSKDYSREGENRYYLNDYLNLQLRSEMVLILDNDLDQWRAGMTDRKYRFGIKNFVKLNFLRNRNFGFLFTHYWGRDYHNIRFDNVYHIWQFGLNFKFGKNPVVSFPGEKYRLYESD